ncbi:MAG: hypothetical protein V1779_13225 [bacterium]
MIELRNIAKLIIAVMIIGFNQLSAQTNNFGIGTLTPHQSAVLHLNSTTKGFLIPRLTEVERLAIPVNPLIPSPATGLMVYQTDATDGYYYWDGIQWLRISTDISTDFVYGEGDEGQVAYWRTSTTLTGSDNLFWDFTNSRLGIGTTTPLEKVDVNGGMIISNTSNSFEGNIRWTGSDFEGWDGTAWRSFTSNTFFGHGENGQVTWWEDHTHITGDYDLFWDNGNSRLGIGTSAPLETLHINGGMIISSTSFTVNGNIRWTGDDFEGWTGAEWKSFTKYLINGHGERGQVTFWRDTYEVTGDWGLFWDIDNLRLGIGTTTPRADLEVNGAIIVSTLTNDAGKQAGTFKYEGNDFLGWMGGEWKTFISAPAIFGAGQPGQVAIWLTDTPPTLTGDNDLFWDNTNKYLGVKTMTPEYEMDVNGEIMIGVNTLDGQFRMYSELGATDYEVVINPHAAMTTNTLYTLPLTDGEPGDLNLLSNDGTGVMFWQDPTKGFSLFWKKVNDVIIQTHDWALGNNQPAFEGTYGTQLLFGRNTSSAWGSYNTLLNGLNNDISAGSYSLIITGEDQTLSGSWSTILGGSEGNSLSGNYSILFGRQNSLTGNNSIIAGGQRTTLVGSGSFVFKGAAPAASVSGDNTFYPLDIQFHHNESNNNADFRIDGQTVDNLFYMDASTDRVGIGTNAPVVKLDVNNGNMAITSSPTSTFSLIFYEPSAGSDFSSFSPASQTANLEYSLPIEHDEPNSILVNDGFGVLEWADPGQFAEYLRSPVVDISASSGTYVAKETDNHIIINNTADFIIYLPPAVSMNGKEFLVKHGPTGGKKVDIWATGTDKIDDVLTNYTIVSAYSSLFLVSDGVGWFVMSSFP